MMDLTMVVLSLTEYFALDRVKIICPIGLDCDRKRIGRTKRRGEASPVSIVALSARGIYHVGVMVGSLILLIYPRSPTFVVGLNTY